MLDILLDKIKETQKESSNKKMNPILRNKLTGSRKSRKTIPRSSTVSLPSGAVLQIKKDNLLNKSIISE